MAFIINQPYPAYFLFKLEHSTIRPIDSYTAKSNDPDTEAKEYFEAAYSLGEFAHIIRKQTVLHEDIVEQL